MANSDCKKFEGKSQPKKDLYLNFMYFFSDTFPVCTKSNDGPIYYENDIVTLTCTMGFNGNQKPKLDWELPRYHVDYEHLQFKEENSVNLVTNI